MTSHVKEQNCWKAYLFSLLGHLFLLIFFLYGAHWLPGRNVLEISSTSGGPIRNDVVGVMLTAELGGGRGMYKPAITPRPEVLQLPPPATAEAEAEPKRNKDFTEKGRPKPKKKTRPTSNVPTQIKKQVPKASSTGALPIHPEPGRDGSSARGLTSGQGVTLGTGQGKGTIDSWYVRQLERRIGSNWLKTSLGQLNHPVQTVLSFEIGTNGEIRNIQKRTSSGIHSIDIAAERAVRASNPLPPLPYELHRRTVRVVAYFDYPPR